MARPTTKIELISASNENFEKLFKTIDSLNCKELNEEFDFSNINKKEAHWKRDKNLRDVLIHLYEWHQLLLCWIRENRNGNETPFLPEPYNWKTYGDMNVKFWEKHQQTALEDSKKMIRQSHEDVMKVIDTFTNEELFSKNAFPWTKTSTLGSYCISATSSHYDWAVKKLRQHVKNCNALKDK